MYTMIKSVIYLILLISSGQGKVILTEDDVISDNLIGNEDVKKHIDLQINQTISEHVQNTSLPESAPNMNDTAGHATSNSSKCANITDINGSLSDFTTNRTCDNEEERVDNGTALILTPFIENGQLEEARNASRVDPGTFLGMESYSGFVTVNKTYNSNIFFWYFPVEKKPVNETPWLIWLQGGPGASSMTGLFDEIGPFRVSSMGFLKRNPYSWLKNHSLVFIDNPVGTGFSFTEHADGYAKDMDTYAKHLYSTVSQLVQIFPELRVAPLYISGESYAGKYVPALAMELHKHRSSPGLDINLQGLILGNAYIDPEMISQITRPFYYFGLLEKEQIEIVDPLLKSFQQDIAAKDSAGAKDKFNSLVQVLLFLTHQKQAYNFLKDELTVGRYASFLRTSEIKRALHVGDIKFSFVNFTVNIQLTPDFLSSSKSIFEELLEHYKVLTYCGQLDQMVPCVFTSEHYRTWHWGGRAEFLEAVRYPYIFNKKLSGYHKSGGNLTEVVVRGAGHMVPVDEPAPAQNLVARWTHGKPLSVRFGLLEGSFIQEYVRNYSTIFL